MVGKYTKILMGEMETLRNKPHSIEIKDSSYWALLNQLIEEMGAECSISGFSLGGNLNFWIGNVQLEDLSLETKQKVESFAEKRYTLEEFSSFERFRYLVESLENPHAKVTDFFCHVEDQTIIVTCRCFLKQKEDFSFIKATVTTSLEIPVRVKWMVLFAELVWNLDLLGWESPWESYHKALGKLVRGEI